MRMVSAVVIPSLLHGFDGYPHGGKHKSLHSGRLQVEFVRGYAGALEDVMQQAQLPAGLYQFFATSSKSDSKPLSLSMASMTRSFSPAFRQ